MLNREVRVGQGGLFHSRKVEYSKETHALLKQLLNESKLSIQQRKALQESVKRGQPLPGPRYSQLEKSHSQLKSSEVIIGPSNHERRSQEAILKSGAYERETFRPAYNKVNHDIEKVRLQNLMTYGKDVSPTEIKIKRSARSENKELVCDEDLAGHLVHEIKERLEFLSDMEAMGEGKAYRPIIEQEVASKVRQLEALSGADKTLPGRDNTVPNRSE